MNSRPGFARRRAWNGLATVLAVVFFRAAVSVSSQEPPYSISSNSLFGSVYNITLVTDSAPDLTDIDSYLRSVTSQYATPQEQAIAIWRWSQRLRKQTTNPVEDGHFVLDPIRMFNSYGYCNCGIISGVNDALWLRMGWQARYVQLGDHTVSECSWDGGKTWHMFDSSMSFYCFNDQGEVASVREIEQNPRFYLENFAPECGTNPVRGPDDHRGWRCASDHPVEYQRTLANGYDSFKPPNDLQEANLLAQWGHRYVLNLRSHEHYTRYFHPLERGGPRTFRPVRGNQDVDANGSIRANGLWRYAPDLRDPATRALIGFESGVTWTKDGVRPVQGTGSVVFKVNAANVVTSAKIRLAATGAAVSISRDAGINWQRLAADFGQAECLDQVAGGTEYLVKVELGGTNALLSSVAIETVTQLNRPALPRLTRGPNRIQVRLGPQVETIQFQPSIVDGNHKRTVHSEKALDVDPQPDFYKPTLRPAEKGTPGYATWKIVTPTPITDLVFGGSVCVKSARDRVTLLHSWDDQTYVPDYRKSDDAMPYDLMVNTAVTSVPPETRTAYLRYEFETDQSARHYAGPGIQMATMTVHHQARNASYVPIEVTYCWIEHRESGDLERRHTELAISPIHGYIIHVGGFRDPTMKWVRMNLKGYGPDGDMVKRGYSDGQDVGPGAKPPRVRYRWGKNLALSRPYTIAGTQDERNPDGGGDLTDGIIAPPDTYVSVKYMPTYVMFARDVSPVITIDLGGEQTVSAVRVHAGQEGGFHLTYPDTIKVETSADGTSFAFAGSVGFNEVFNPPADYVPWELDEAAIFDDLPAGGRLAYAYGVLFERPVSARYVRIACDSRKGWGMLLSELQVFDRFTVDTNVPPLVSLPPVTAPVRPSTARSPLPSAGLEFIDTSFENASPLWYEFAPDGTINVHLLYDHERSSPNRAAGHFHFLIQAKAGSQLTLEFKNLDNIWNGQPGSVARELKTAVISSDGREWKSIPLESLPENRVRLTIRMPGPRLYVARVEPYRLSDLDHLLASIRNNRLVKIDSIGKTVQGRELEIVRIGNPRARYRVFLRARAHPWEAGSSWVVQGLIRRLLLNDKLSGKYLERYCVYVLPMANKDGVAGGRTRFNLEGRDLNRDWDKPADPQFAPENHALETWLETMTKAGQRPHLALELHNDGGGQLHISRPEVPQLKMHLERMATFERLLRRHTWFTEGSTQGTFRNSGTLGDGWLERYGIDAVVHEFNCNWIEGRKDYPSARHWEEYGASLATVFYEYFDSVKP